MWKNEENDDGNARYSIYKPNRASTYYCQIQKQPLQSSYKAGETKDAATTSLISANAQAWK